MSRTARKLSRRRSSFITSLRGKKKERNGGFSDEETEGELEEEEMQGEDGVWRRTILMGEKCQPLDFSGVIYYDADGRQLPAVPTPRSPLRSPLPSFAQKSSVTDGYLGSSDRKERLGEKQQPILVVKAPTGQDYKQQRELLTKSEHVRRSESSVSLLNPE
ncbi:hypothetical protein BHM03_00030339 [Ensete ventricosum]|nr:hypothetical protein BHM03_00030339 [Ensete ventricosum]